jgi:hypothetical protein
MRQIVLAVNTYEQGQRQYPMNWGIDSTVGTPSTGQGLGTQGQSWYIAVLPNLDNAPLYSSIYLTNSNPANWAMSYQNAAAGYDNVKAAQTVIPTFMCPTGVTRGAIASPAFDGGAAMYAPTYYKACAGMNWAWSWNTSTNAVNQSTGSSWARGRNSNSTDGLDHGNGVICRGGGTGTAPANLSPQPQMTTNMDVRDGLSTTIFLGESVPLWCNWSFWMWFDGTVGTCGLPMNYFHQTQPVANDGLANANTWQYAYAFMSQHRGGGCNFAACDGSVHFLAENIDFTVYQGLATIDGFETVQWPQ